MAVARASVTDIDLKACPSARGLAARVALFHLSTATGSTFVFRLRGPSRVISPSSRFKISSDSYIGIDSLFGCLVLRAFRAEACFGDLVAESMGDWEKESAVWSQLPFQWLWRCVSLWRQMRWTRRSCQHRLCCGIRTVRDKDLKTQETHLW